MTRRSRRTLALLAVLFAALATAPDGRAAGVVFRYLPGQPSLSSEVVAAGVETGPFLDPRHLAARGPGGWGLQAPLAAEFEAPASTLRSADATPISQPLGPRLTAEAWVHPGDLTGPTVLVGNRISGAGAFELGLDGPTPYLVVGVGGRDVRVDAAAPVTVGASVWIAATARFDPGAQRLHLSLYVDGHLAGASATDLSVPSPYGIGRPFFVGTEATGTPESYTLEGRLTAQVLGVVVRDYVADDAYLTSSVPLDGGPYLGLPAYHDAPLTGFQMPVDQRIRATPAAVRHRFFLPYVNDEFVPQGTATTVEGTGDDATELVYLSYYHLTRGGATDGRRSIVVEMDAATGHVRRTFRLMGRLGYSHAGGIAFAKGAIYVSSSSTLERYPLPAYEGPEGPRYVDLEADDAGTISVYSRASFVSTHRDTLWVGDWRTPSQEPPYLYGYPMDADGRAVRGATPRIYALPRSVQGVDFFEHRGQTYVFMARNRSLSRGEAEILRVPRSRLARWTEPTPDSTITVPYGIEDLSFFPDGTLWTNSESGADYYQKTEEWPVFYPFVYSLTAEAVFGSAVATPTEPGGGAPGLRLGAAPNPFHDRTALTLEVRATGRARLHVTDTLGREVATLLDGPVAPGSHTIQWEAASAAPGVYFVVLEAGGERVVRAVTLAR